MSLEIRLLGKLEVLRDGRSLPLPPSKKTRALLAYPAADSHAHTRAHLCELLDRLRRARRGVERQRRGCGTVPRAAA